MGSIVLTRASGAAPSYSAAINDFLASANAAAARTALALGSGDTPTFKGLTLAQGTLTDSAVGLDLTATWNDAADTFTVIRGRVTDTASAAGSLLMDLGTAAGGSRFAVRKNGALGIGGVAPDSMLHILGPLGSEGQMQIQDSGGAGAASGHLIEFRDNAGARIAYIYKEPGSNKFAIINEGIGGAFGFGVGGADRLYIANDGKVSIGSLAPAEMLDVSGNCVVSGFYLLPGGVKIVSGSGTPEAALTAPIGSTYHRTDGGAGTSFYVKESGAGNTGWQPK